MSVSSLPDPHESYFFRNAYLSEALSKCREEVVQKYDAKTVATIVDGDYRGKDSFSLRCVDIEAAIQDGSGEADALPIVDEWYPIKRRDMHPDDVTPSQSIQWDPFDAVYLQRLTTGDRSGGLSVKAAQRAKGLLYKGELSTDEPNQRVPLSASFVKALGTFEQVDVSAPLRPEQKQKIPSVHSTQNIWHYLDLKRQNQFAQNLEDTQAEGSYLVVGATEAATMPALPGLLQRHGYTPHKEWNDTIKRQMQENTILKERKDDYTIEGLDPFVYQKTGR